MDEMIGLVPAAGGGTRLYPFSKAVPKEMYPVQGKVAIEHSIDNLKAGGIDRAFVVVGHQKGALMDYLGNGKHFGVKLSYIYQYERKGLGHAILQAREWINTPFIVILGDSFIEPNTEIQKLRALHERERPIATLLLFEVNDPEGYGIVRLDGDSVRELIEKPSKEEAQNIKNNGKFLAITGVYAFDPEIFNYIAKTQPGKKGEIQITDAIELAVRDGKKVKALVMTGKYRDLGRWKTVIEIEKEWAERVNVDRVVAEREELRRRIKND